MITSDVSFTYDPFKTHRSFNWMNDIKGERTNLGTFLKEEFIEITFYLEAKSLYIFKDLNITGF